MWEWLAWCAALVHNVGYGLGAQAPYWPWWYYLLLSGLLVGWLWGSYRALRYVWDVLKLCKEQREFVERLRRTPRATDEERAACKRRIRHLCNGAGNGSDKE